MMSFFRRPRASRDGKRNSQGSSAVNSPRSRISLGICCMGAKLQSKPMQALVSRLEKTGVFEIFQFPEETLLHSPVEEWPVVQGLIAFHSSGFPLEKATQYVQLRRPVELNRLDHQQELRDRVKVYEKLKSYEVPVPAYLVIDHLAMAAAGSAAKLEEEDDYIVYEGVKLAKPFVEKPVDADDHNIWVYYPVTNVGGGCKKLIRKVEDKSSEFCPLTNRIRRDKTYIYEPFLPTQGMDVKVYTVGTEYSHAEARKAPTVDGKVQRSADGKEVRFPITLTETEKACGALIVKAFKQYICGFDVLRTNGGSLVCDVNGFSFVKGNRRYYDDCAYLVTKFFLDQVPHHTSAPLSPPAAPSLALDSPTKEEDADLTDAERAEDEEQQGRLRSVIVFMRHADRKPKEKFKFETSDAVFVDYLASKASGSGTSGASGVGAGSLPVGEVLLKSPEELTGLLEKLQQQRGLRTGEGAGGEEAENVRQMLEMRDTFSGLTRKVQIKRTEREDVVLVVAKWGGDLTSLGRAQAEELGREMRSTLFTDEECLLRLHSSFRHDFRIYSSQEGRCQTTAAAFTKGLLDLDGDLAPILVSLISADGFAHELLDHPIPKQDRDVVKKTISDLLHSRATGKEGLQALTGEAGEEARGLREAAREIVGKFGSPRTALEKLVEGCEEFLRKLEEAMTARKRSRVASPFGPRIPKVSDGETVRQATLLRIEHRWRKMVSGLRGGEETGGSYTRDVSKIPEISDSVGFDLLHNAEMLQGAPLQTLREVQAVVTPLHAWISACEFGISEKDKMRIGTAITWRLLQKLLSDVEYMVASSGAETNAAPMSSSASGLLGAGPGGMSSHGSGNFQTNSPKNDTDSAPGGTAGTSAFNSPAVHAGIAPRRAKMPPELRALMRQAMRDGSDWHPKLLSTVARVTGMESEEAKSVRTRVYVTSASTMHSLLNVLNSDPKVISSDSLQDVTDLHYLSHIVIRCFENPKQVAEGEEPQQLAQFSVELSFSPGVSADGKTMLPAVSICPTGECCSLEDLDNHISGILADSGHLGQSFTVNK